MCYKLKINIKINNIFKITCSRLESMHNTYFIDYDFYK